MNPLISICIPAYKRIEFLKRLLDSISIQTFKDFEVIITDDSPGNDVKALCNEYGNKFTVLYNRNEQPLGTPENWNEAIRNAKGQWIKLIHDDDWFSNENSLQSFAETIKKNPAVSFIFSAYCNVYIDKNKQEDVFIDRFRYKLLKKNPTTLFSKNIIGPPSVTIYRNDNIFFYDKNLKWLVDIDFYIRYLQNRKSVYINSVLINVGISTEQVTKAAFRTRNIEIPESFYLLNKTGVHQLRNIFVYDTWWRLIRNLGIRNINDLNESNYEQPVPVVIDKMIFFQNKIPVSILRTGFLSKFFMALSYIINNLKFDNAD